MFSLCRMHNYAISSTFYIMVLCPTCPTWYNCSNHQTTTLFLQCTDNCMTIHHKGRSYFDSANSHGLMTDISAMGPKELTAFKLMYMQLIS